MPIKLNNLRLTVDNVTQEIVNKGLEQVAILVADKAREKAPKDIGNLARSIDYEITDNEAHIFSPESYAPYVELGTGIFASDGNGRQTPWRYFYTGGKLSNEELDYITKYGKQVHDGMTGIWRTTKGQKPQPYLKPALEESIQDIENIFNNLGGSVKW